MFRTPVFLMLCLAALGSAFLLADPALAQGYHPRPVPGYSYTETAPSQQPLLFGVAAYKICQIKSFLFAAVYVLGAIAFVIFAIRALFTKFELKHFVPILGALFIVATADLFISWMTTDAYFCPSTFTVMSGG